MNSAIIYKELADFIASSTTPKIVANFRPSKQSKNRVSDLIEREKTKGLSIEETKELNNYLALEHLMRLAKARARHDLKLT